MSTTTAPGGWGKGSMSITKMNLQAFCSGLPHKQWKTLVKNDGNHADADRGRTHDV